MPAGERWAEGLGERVERRPRAIDEVLDAVRDELVAGEHEHEEGHDGEIRAPAQFVQEIGIAISGTIGQSPRSVIQVITRVESSVA